MVTSSLREVKCRSVNEFLRQIDPRKNGLEPRYHGDLILYRGHANAEWTLIPSGHRGANGTNHDCVRLEHAIVHRLHRVCDANGLPFPGDGPHYQEGWREAQERHLSACSPFGLNWPELYPGLALAQHHGLPTSVLDWSYDPDRAGYHACIPHLVYLAEGKPSIADEICVWRMDLRSHVPRAEIGMPGAACSVILPPRSSNPNLLAQDGALTLLRRFPDLPADARFTPCPLENLVVDDSTDRSAPDFWPRLEGVHLTKICLSARHVPELLTILGSRRVDAARLFPGVDGAVRSMKEADLIEQAKRVAVNRRQVGARPRDPARHVR